MLINSNWKEFGFGKYKGLTAAQIFWKDTDYLYWADDNQIVKDSILLQQVRFVAERAKFIKIPEKFGNNLVVEYYFDHRGVFHRMEIVNANIPDEKNFGRCRVAHIDSYMPRQGKHYDKCGYDLFIRGVKFYCFGNESYRMTKTRCERFFEDDSNFLLDLPVAV